MGSKAGGLMTPCGCVTKQLQKKQRMAEFARISRASHRREEAAEARVQLWNTRLAHPDHLPNSDRLFYRRRRQK
jgi:hypothetical protein